MLRQFLGNHIEKRKEWHSKAKRKEHEVDCMLQLRLVTNSYPLLAENQQAILPEYAVSHAIYLISHHPEFSRTKPLSLDTFKE